MKSPIEEASKTCSVLECRRRVFGHVTAVAKNAQCSVQVK